MLPCSRAQLWLYLPAQAHPVRGSACCQLQMLSERLGQGHRGKKSDHLNLDPNQVYYPFVTVFEQQLLKLIIFFPRLSSVTGDTSWLFWPVGRGNSARERAWLLHFRVRQGRKVQSLSWYFMAGAFKAISGQPFFPGRPSRPTLREGVPITGLPAVQLVVTDWPVLWTRQQATKYFPVGYIHSTCLGLQLLLYQLLFLPPRICICVFSVLS